MKLSCVMPVRNEGWCLGLSARAVLMWCDELIVLEHASTDSTYSIICDLVREYGSRVKVLFESDPVWEEMRHRQKLLDAARQFGATHIVMVDADEVLTSNLLQQVRGYVDWLSRIKVGILQLPWIQLRDSIHNMHNSGVWADQQVSMAFEDAPDLHWVARDGYDFHHRHPMGRELIPYRPLQRSQGGLMHLQMVSERRLKAKQALYQMQEVVRWPGRNSADEIRKMYSLAVYGSANDAAHTPVWVPRNARRAGEAPADVQPFAAVPDAWWAGYAHLMQYLDVSAEPWQEARCKEMMAEHGPQIFQGLDLFGVCG